MSNKETVVVIGAGLSGLSAAKLLHERGVEVVVLEANDQVGGRTLTLTPSAEAGDPEYGWADLGASYVAQTQNNIQRMCKELNCELYLARDDHDSIYFNKGRKCCHSSLWPGFWWSNPFAAMDLRAVIRKIDDMVLQVPTDRPWQASHAIEWDQITVKDFLNKHCWTRDAREFIEAMSVISNSAEVHEMSLLFFLWQLHQAQGVKSMWDASEEQKIVGGSQQLSIKIAKKLGERIYLNKPVVHIQCMDDGVMVKALDGTIFNGSYVILAIPPHAHLKIHFDPPLPPLRHGLIQRSPMGLVIKCVVFYNREFWIEKGYSGFVSCCDGVEVVGNVCDDHKPGVSLYGLICFIFGKHAISLNKMDQPARRDAVCQCLAKFYDSQEALKPEHYVDKLWLEEPYIGGCYNAYNQPGVLSRYGPAIREPIGSRIYIAGTETALQWTGFLDGAIEAGERAAREVLHAQGTISHSDVWVTEPESSEVPLLSTQLPTLQACQLSRTLFISFGAVIIGLLLSAFFVNST